MKVEKQTKEVIVAHVVTLSAKELSIIKEAVVNHPKGTNWSEHPEARKLLLEMCGSVDVPKHEDRKQNNKPAAPSKGNDRMWKVCAKLRTPNAISCIVDILVAHDVVANNDIAKSHAVCDISNEIYNEIEDNGSFNLDKEVVLVKTPDYTKAQDLYNDLKNATCVIARIEEDK